SEVAAALINWGFLLALVLIVWGFVRRQSNIFTALLAISVLVSAPTLAWFTTAIKNDFPVAVFLFAHFYTLTKYEDSNNSKPWILLSGILCGGAIGHKLTAAPVALISTVFILFKDLR